MNRRVRIRDIASAAHRVPVLDLGLLALVGGLTALALTVQSFGVGLVIHGCLLVAGATLLVRSRLFVRDRSLQLAERDRFFSLSRDMLCVATLDGYFVDVNEAFRQTLGHDLESLYSVPLVDFVHAEDLLITESALGGLVSGDPLHAFENRYRCSDGTYKWLEWDAVASPEDGLIYASARDVTKRRKTDDHRLRHDVELEMLARKLAASNAELDAFAYTASHDLSAPLVSIEGFAASLQRRAGDSLDETSAMYVARIRANALALRRLIKDLHEYARAGAGEPVDALDGDALTREVVAEINAQSAEADLIQVVGRIPSFRAHPVRYKQALTNLLENSLHYGRVEGRALEVQIVGLAENGHVEIVVEDNGNGVLADDRVKMFDLFARGRMSRKTSPDGTGIGLALVKKIAESSGGTIRYHAREGRGARFVLSLPKGESA